MNACVFPFTNMEITYKSCRKNVGLESWKIKNPVSADW
jgi:hypothetical protein